MPTPFQEDFFGHADHLLDYRRPIHEIDVRRAVSAAYYGVFHLICTDAADLFAQKTQRNQPSYVYVYRSLAHDVLRKGCAAVQKQDPSVRAMQQDVSFTNELVQFAATTIGLQAARHSADYDPVAPHSEAQARAHILSARKAVDSHRSITQIERRTFLTFLMFKSRA